jgi:cell fate (sporulation/competence/biofilm development) regulator YmcA (YheA/YmcA/DUF963 family)
MPINPTIIQRLEFIRSFKYEPRMRARKITKAIDQIGNYQKDPFLLKKNKAVRY